MSQVTARIADARLIAELLAHRAEAPQAILTGVIGAARDFSRGAVQSDDVTAVVLRYVGR